MSLLMLFMALAPETFLKSRIYVAYMSTIPFTLIMALAMTLVIIAGEIDLSFPSVMATGGFVFSNVLTLTGGFLPAAAAALAAGAFAGAVNGFLVVKIGVPSIIATIGTQFFWRGAVVLASGGLAISLSDFRDTFWQHLLTGRFFSLIPSQALWAVFLAVVLWLVLNRHPYGDNLRFSGDNDAAASAMGIPVGRTKVMLFILMGIVSAFSGMLVC
ncbi:MAG: ABC transporter permease, partial [Desulfobacterales bacterium]|nr:ABC transporter permease [Desulfobacterales bacterium]